jgi:hypothetical protein
MRLAPHNTGLLERLQLFVVARPETVTHFDLRPFSIETRHTFDPLHRDSVPFLRLLQRLDQVTFGPEGMPMPRWVYLDGAEMTGGIVGFGLPASSAPDSARSLLGVPPDYRGLVPYAVYIAIPTFEAGTWFGHNLASVASLLPDQDLSGLGSLTKAVALKLFRTRVQLGATQWHSRALYVHARLGALELLTTDTPAHGDPDTLTYRARISDDILRNLAREPGAHVHIPPAGEWVESTDLARIRALQLDIEAGARYVIAGRPRPSAAGQQVPIAKLT